MLINIMNDKLASLSSQERKILSFILSGYGNKEISNLTNLSPHTVGTHIRHIFLKMNVHSRADLRAAVNHTPFNYSSLESRASTG